MTDSSQPKTPANHGEVFTRGWIVDLILDLSAYTSDRDLTTLAVVEPSIGSGAFATALCKRLSQSKNRHHPDRQWSELSGCIRGWDLNPHHVDSSRTRVVAILRDHGCPDDESERLADKWFQVGDFLLLASHEAQADLVVGNPPYIRIEDVDSARLVEYRETCHTMTGRADIFVGFYEKALDLLSDAGMLAFICADRWMLNSYGKRLRGKIVTGPFSMDTVLSMHDVDAFETPVSAYPAITVLRHGPQGPVLIADCRSDFDETCARELLAAERSDDSLKLVTGASAALLPDWHDTELSWPFGSPSTIAWLEHLEEAFPLLEDSSPTTRIGIGVATGADTIYVKEMDELPFVESDRLLPLAVSADVNTGVFSWNGRHLVSPWDKNGLVNLTEYPKLAAYYEEHATRLLGRNIAKKRPATWYQTIDRVNLALLESDMLVLGDMRKHARPVRVKAGYYPHHNLYFIVSEEWDLDVLGGLIMSEQVEAQVAAFCVKMRGGTLRFQAQYLRRVRVPNPSSIPDEIAERLIAAFRDLDPSAATEAAGRLFKSAGVRMPT